MAERKLARLTFNGYSRSLNKGSVRLPTLSSIRLRNFKGAKDVTIEISKAQSNPVITLIGLNESGKTTVLEGISYFVTGDNAVTSVFERDPQTLSLSTLIPIHRKAAFTGTIEIEGEVHLDSDDAERALKLVKARKLELDTSQFPASFTVIRNYRFEDSVLKETRNYWNLELLTRTAKRGKSAKYSRLSEQDQDLWL